MTTATIIGEKVTLRPYQPDDALPLYQGAMNPVLRRLTGTQASFTLEQVQTYVARQADAEDRAGFIIAKPDTLEAFGEVVINNLDDENRSANIRITLFSEDALGKGYGTEAMRLAVDYGFKTLKLHRISLDVFDFNPRAIRVYEKIGFRQEGVQRDTLFYDGEFHSSVMMAILENEWPPTA